MPRTHPSGIQPVPGRRRTRTLCAALTLAAAAAAIAQAPVYPPPADAPQAAPHVQPQPRPPGRFRRFFANTLGVIADATGQSLTANLAHAITGGISDWFERKAGAKTSSRPAYSGTATDYPYQSAGYPPTYAPSPVDQGQQPQYSAEFYDPATGTATVPDPYAATAATESDAGLLFAGLAYEVHLLAPDGGTVPVNPAAHEFHTGDRFIVLYRPTLPGRMQVYNINPAGRETQIDALDIAAGQLARLGPYEFAAMRGDEQLRLILAPCATQSAPLLTRDIVNVAQAYGGQSGYQINDAYAAASPDSLQFNSCTSVASRSATAMRTRDIRKVAVEDLTAFAFDPIAAQERASGDFAPRELTIVFHHR